MKKMLLIAFAALLSAACSSSSDDVTPTVCPTLNTRSYAGTLDVTPLAGGSASQFSDVRFDIEHSGDGKSATLHMIETRFVEQMPRLDMDVPGIGCTHGAGGYVLSGDAIVPLCKGVPYKQYVITSLHGTESEQLLRVEFDCMGFHVVYSGKKE